MALAGFDRENYPLASLSYDDKHVNGGSAGTMPGYVTANDMNEIKAAIALNNDTLSEYSQDVHDTIETLDSLVHNAKEVITEQEEVSVQAKIEAFRSSLG